jgi:8-oxo-dGTP diphosphatase
LHDVAESGSGTPAADPGFPHPYLTVDVVLLTVRAGQLGVVAIDRKQRPRAWALPGAFVQIDEDVDQTARRVLEDKLGIARVPRFIALKPFGTVDRDPRRRVITLPHVALVDLDRLGRGAGSGGQPWGLGAMEVGESQVSVTVNGRVEHLAFDHEDILLEAVRELRRRVDLDDPEVHAQLLPAEFTLRRLQEVHEAIMGRSVNRDSFRRRVLTSGRLDATGHRETDVEHRPAELYRWRDRQLG